MWVRLVYKFLDHKKTPEQLANKCLQMGGLVLQKKLAGKAASPVGTSGGEKKDIPHLIFRMAEAGNISV